MICTHPPVPALRRGQLGQHLLLHPPAVAHHQLENHQGVGGRGGRGLILVLASDGLAVSLQGQEGVAEVVAAVALLDEELFTLGLMTEGGTWRREGRGGSCRLT